MEKAHPLNPNPEFSLETVSSLHIAEPFAHLMMHAIDSVTIDGHRLVSVDIFERNHDDTMHVVCSTEEGTSHLFAFNPFEEGTIVHIPIPVEEA